MSPSSAGVIKPSGFFVFRTPLLPREVMTRFSADLDAARPIATPEDLECALARDYAVLCARLTDWVRNPIVREALFVASPSLDEALEAWLADPDSPKTHDVLITLSRYLARMAARPTPFGLFSGCSTGAIVDLHKPARGAELSGEIIDELQRAARLLARIGGCGQSDRLGHFREALRERYGERLGGPLGERTTVPLVEVLDEESGIGFPPTRAGVAEPSPLLAGLDFPAESERQTAPLGARERHLMRRLGEVHRARSHTLALDDHDLEILGSASSPTIPGAFAVTATLAAESQEAVQRGDFRLLVREVTGPSGALLFGRFCHGDVALRAAVAAHLAEEEAANPAPIFAEIVHLPEGRVGNILCRPLLRSYEIPYLGRSGAPRAQQIPVTDLRIGLLNDRLILWSVRHQREVIVRLTSAHNHEMAGLGIYRFLCALQQTPVNGLRWSWGALEATPFLPRVTIGRLVLSPACWHLYKDQLATLHKATTRGERYLAVQQLRAELALPRWVTVADGDNLLPIDFANVLAVESFVQLVKARDAATLVELFEGESPLAEGPEGRFVHELIVPFLAKAQPSAAAPQLGAAPRSAVLRSRPPGSEWLSAKLYTGAATADVILREVVAPIIEDARQSGIARSWFFIRYGDPHWHVRLRIRGDSRELAHRTLPALREAAEPLLLEGRLYKLMLDTYEREVARYDGPEGIELAESIFEGDSDAVLTIVKLFDGDAGSDARSRLALRGIHLLLIDLGLDLGQRMELLARCHALFAAEHRVNAAFEKQLGARFRAERRALAELLAIPVGTEHPLNQGFAALAQGSAAISWAVRELRTRERAGRLDLTVCELAASFIHMHVNRLLRSEQRAQELVLYDWLLRLYESEAALAKQKRLQLPSPST